MTRHWFANLSTTTVSRSAPSPTASIVRAPRENWRRATIRPCISDPLHHRDTNHSMCRLGYEVSFAPTANHRAALVAR
jgi:hypothetical protein